MGLEMGDTLLYDFMHCMTVVSLEMSDEPKKMLESAWEKWLIPL